MVFYTIEKPPVQIMANGDVPRGIPQNSSSLPQLMSPVFKVRLLVQKKVFQIYKIANSHPKVYNPLPHSNYCLYSDQN